MKIKISRTSARSEDESPCPQAFFEDGFWWVELTTLEELFALKQELDEPLIIGTDFDKDRTHGSVPIGIDIEIYDDHRE